MYAENYNKVTYRINWGGKMTPSVFWILIATGAVFVVQIASGNRIGGADLTKLFGVNAAAFRPWQLITSLFLHGDVFHILFNMLLLWMLGKDVERTIGAKKFLVLYFAGGIVAGLCWLGIEVLSGGAAVAIGASGAVFAVLVAYAVLFPDRRFFFIRAPYFVIGLIIFEVLMSISGGDGVAHTAHVGGAAFGFLFFKGAPVWDGIIGGFRRRKLRRTYRDEVRTRAKVDALLEKISRDGIDSLSEGEKAFLKKASQRFEHTRSSWTNRNYPPNA